MSQRNKKYQPPEFARAAQAPAAVRAKVGRQTSNAAGPHGDRRHRRVRTRGAADRAAIAANR